MCRVLAVLALVLILTSIATSCALCGSAGANLNPVGAIQPLGLSKRDQYATCIERWQKIDYIITFDNLANDSEVHNVVVTDSLPGYTYYIGCTDGGDYDPDTHSIVWNLGALDPHCQDSLWIRIGAQSTTPEGTYLVNLCKIASDETGITVAAESTQICPIAMNNPMIVRKSNDFSGSCQVPGGIVRHTILVINPPENGHIDNIYITDHLSSVTDFVACSYGGDYDEDEHTIIWYQPGLISGHSVTVSLSVQVVPGTLPGAVIFNDCDVVARNAYPSETQDTVVVCEDQLAPLSLGKAVTPDGDCVPRVQLTYSLAYDNNANAVEVPGVVLTDYLPDEVEFLSATGSGVYNSDTHAVIWNLETVGSGVAGSEQLVVRVRADAESWSTFTNHSEIIGEAAAVRTASKSTRVCGAYGNTCAKVAIHLEPHASRTCSKNFPAITRCEDIVYETDSTEVDAFPVFFDLEEYQGFEYGLSWPGTSTCAFTSCSNLTIGNITEPGDGIAHAWYSCQPGPIGIPGWAWVEVETPGQICVVGHPWTYVISIGDCQDVPQLDQPEHAYCAGVAGGEGENPCGYPTNVKPTTWGEIKAMFK